MIDTKQFPKFEVENLGDDDANLWLVKASRGGLFGVASHRDSLKARENALAGLERKERCQINSNIGVNKVK